MTTEEAIAYWEVFQREIDLLYPLCDERSKATLGEQREPVALALSALRAQQQAEANKPLSLDELRQMGQRCECIYVARVDGTPVFRGQKYCAAVLDFSPAFGSSALHVHAIYGDRLTLWEDDYGKTWLAYRHKPKEA